MRDEWAFAKPSRGTNHGSIRPDRGHRKGALKRREMDHGPSWLSYREVKARLVPVMELIQQMGEARRVFQQSRPKRQGKETCP
jgi:hypothetical protein